MDDKLIEKILENKWMSDQEYVRGFHDGFKEGYTQALNVVVEAVKKCGAKAIQDYFLATNATKIPF